jgi:hypothetical protein
MPAGWVFENVLELVAAKLGVDDPSLGETFLEARTHVGIGYLDLSELDEGQFRLVIEAAETAYEQVVQEGPGAFHDPSFYPAFAERFSEWKALLRSDRRSNGDHNPAGRLIVANGVWEAPGWLFDMVLEHLAVALPTEADSLSTLLMASRTFKGTASCDLRAIGPELLQQLREASGRLRAYSEGKRRAFSAPSFLAEVTPRLVELDGLLHSTASG